MHRIFISYARENIEIAEDLEHRLRENGLTVFRDEEDLKIGDNWREVVKKSIAECDSFLLLWSSYSAQSHNVMGELVIAIEDKKKIFPCVIDNTEPTPLLKGFHYHRLTDVASQFDDFFQNLNLEALDEYDSLPADLKYAYLKYKKGINKRYSILQGLFSTKNKAIEKSYIELNFCEGLIQCHIGGLSPKKLLSKLIDRPEKFIIAGHPGTGKTSTLHYLMYKWSTISDSSLAVFTTLKYYNPNYHEKFDDFIKEEFSNGTTIDVRKAFKKTNIFKEYRCLILLDGLDEVSAGYYSSLIDKLNDFSLRYRNCSFVITTRIDSFRDIKEEDFRDWNIFSIELLDEARINKFISIWFEDSDKYNMLLNKIMDNPRLSGLATRPFLLALMCLVFEEDGSIGQNRSALYEKATSFLESSRNSNQVSKTISQRRLVLKEIALWYLKVNSDNISKKILYAIVDDILDYKNIDQIKQFLNDLVNDTGMIQFSGNSYTFVHKSFQEYYAALSFKDKRIDLSLIVDFCQVSHWEEPIRLYAGSLDTCSDQEALLRGIWLKNPALSLRASIECHHVNHLFLKDLILNNSAKERVRMLNEIEHSLGTIDRLDAQRLVVETLTKLFEIDNDSSVLYFGVKLLENYDPDDIGQIMHNTFRKEAELLLAKLQKNPKYKFEFVTIESGKFIMGNNNSKDKIERPEHKVSVDKFAILKYQLTNLAFEEIFGLSHSRREEGVSIKDDQPVVNINWYDAYICGLKLGCRLPSEAEWEYACRAGSKAEWCFGDDVNELKEYANYEDIGIGAPLPVGQKKSNQWDLFDMHGNVWEWCSDLLKPYTKSVTEVESIEDEEDRRVRRGGGFAYHARGCRSAFRWGNDPNYSFKDIGVRLVMDLK